MARKATHILVSTGGPKDATESAGAQGRADSADGIAASANAPLLQTTDVVLAYGKAQILDGISLTPEPGDCTLLLGESGSGKTTLSRCIAGLNDDYSGTVALRGTELAKSTRKRTNEQRVGIHLPVTVLLTQPA
ncbi:ATP-binding cassette domain-containing protein [Brevibacterium aurantiacum]|uniref:ATP-binding cassette domain-containing protein n=1 Tax=Brevibacterium aurantiacum TaxID=273384 RepID=UPI00299F8C09|nr:ATP-binding cassette domain-containing protein [Brevibacterium aurantiacum]